MAGTPWLGPASPCCVTPFLGSANGQNLLILQSADHGCRVQPFERTARGGNQPSVITMNAREFGIGSGRLKRALFRRCAGLTLRLT